MNNIKRLQMENTELEKQLNKENFAAEMDMIVYLRGSEINDYQQEVIREDIINLLLDGQSRNENVDQIIGKDKKEFMDNVIASVPKKSFIEKISENLSLILTLFSIFATIYLVRDMMVSLFKNKKLAEVINISVVDIVIALFIIIVSQSIN